METVEVLFVRGKRTKSITCTYARDKKAKKIQYLYSVPSTRCTIFGTPQIHVHEHSHGLMGKEQVRKKEEENCSPAACRRAP